MDRRQKKLQLVLISPDSFAAAPAAGGDWSANGMQDDSSPPSSNDDCQVKFQVIASTTSENWVSVNDTLTFLRSDDPGSTVRFLWSNEDTGYRHLYLLTSHLGGLAEGEGGDRATEVECLVHPTVIQRETLTSGSWPVSEERVWVDEAHGLVYFTGYKDTPLEKHLYVTSLVRPGDVRRLTAMGSSHSSVEMNEVCTSIRKSFPNPYIIGLSCIIVSFSPAQCS